MTLLWEAFRGIHTISSLSELSAFPSQEKKTCDTHKKHQDTYPLGYRKVPHDKPPADISTEEFNRKTEECIEEKI